MYPAEMDDLRKKVNDLQTEAKVSKDRHLALAAIDESQRKEMADNIKKMEFETLKLVSKSAVASYGQSSPVVGGSVEEATGSSPPPITDGNEESKDKSLGKLISESSMGNGKVDKSSLSREEKEKKARYNYNKIEYAPIDSVLSEGRKCCTFQLTGACKAGDSCTFWYARTGKGLCAKFQTKRGCDRGSYCGFDHVAVGADAAKFLRRNIRPRSNSPARIQPPCRLFKDGKCTFGNKCRFAHPI
jgi:hypothetical protein